jgi:cytochrome c-type biogenesis protein CcmH
VNANALKRWPGWAALVLVLVALLTIGVTRDGGPRTQQDRVDSISKRLACPTCDGESVYESRAPISESIRNDIARQVAEGVASDEEIIESINAAQPTSIILTPKSSGIEALIWVLPVTLLLMALAGLAVAFRRWHREIDDAPTDEDRELVAAALQREWGPDAGGSTE